MLPFTQFCPPFPSFVASGASHPACSYFWMLLLSPQWKLKHTSPNAARAAVHPWAQHSCSVPLSRTEGGEDPAPPSPVNDFRLLSWTESHSAIREGSLIDPQRGFPSTYTWCHPEGDAGAPPGALLWQRLTLLCPTLQCNENIQKYLPWPLPTQLSHTGTPLPSHLSGRHQAPKAGSCFYHPQPSPPSLLHLATFCAPFNPI